MPSFLPSYFSATPGTVPTFRSSTAALSPTAASPSRSPVSVHVPRPLHRGGGGGGGELPRSPSSFPPPPPRPTGQEGLILFETHDIPEQP